MSNRREYWDRVGCVKIEDASGKMIEYRGLDFKFKVKSIAGIYNDFSVGVLGLSAKTINDLTIWNPSKAIKSPRKIEVYAGYAKTGEEVVATGYIWYAVPSRPPEMWMNFECRKFLKYSEGVEKPRVLEKKTVREIFNEICAECGYRADFRAENGDVEVATYTIEGKKGNLLKKFVDTFNKCVGERFGICTCIEPHGERGTPRKLIRASQETGLLSVGGVNIRGAKITTRLRTDVNVFDWIELNSLLIPSASGPYYVIETEIEGHLRGEKWESNFDCLRKV